MNRFKEKYEKEVVPALKKEFGIKNPNALPAVTKIVVNMGIGKIARNKELMQEAINDLATITGQKPQVRPAKVSVASFGLRRGMPVGLKVTLRGVKMYSFLDRLFSIVLPRLRDFRGVSRKGFDGHGNYSLGFEEHTVFPEIDITKSQSKGLEATIVTNIKDKERSEKLLEYLGMPFEKNSAENKQQATKGKG